MPKVKISCAGCPYLIDSEFGCRCMATSCPEEEEQYDFSKIPTFESKDILVFKFNTQVAPEKEDHIIDTWTCKLKEMRDVGIIVLPKFLDLVTMLPGDVDIKIYNSEGEELCLEQKKL